MSLRPPITRARSRISDFSIGRSLTTQMSSGSPSPRSQPGASFAMREPQYVFGMKPYKAGGCEVVRWGRSTRR
jgi:hypothetical protein